MNRIIHHPKPDSNPRSRLNQKLIIHYTLGGHVVCEAEYRLTSDQKYIELPIPVQHRLMMGQ